MEPFDIAYAQELSAKQAAKGLAVKAASEAREAADRAMQAAEAAALAIPSEGADSGPYLKARAAWMAACEAEMVAFRAYAEAAEAALGQWSDQYV